jgi:perosamine synthetase
VYVIQVPPAVDRDAAVRGLRERGVDSKPYMPAIHLMSFYRERFGHREGEFPVCEEVSRRSLALPFYPELSESHVERVTETLLGIIESSAPGPRSKGSSVETPG